MTDSTYDYPSHWTAGTRRSWTMVVGAVCAVFVVSATDVRPATASAQCDVPLRGLAISADSGAIVICNRWYRAIFSEATGMLSAVRLVIDRDSSGDDAFDSELIIRLRGRETGIRPVELVPVGLTVDEAHDFYVRVSAIFRIAASVDGPVVRRTYEFTRSPHFYEQVALSGPTTTAFGNPRSDRTASDSNVSLDHLTWRVRGHEHLRPLASSEDLLIEQPAGRLGAYDLLLQGQTMDTEFQHGYSYERRIVDEGRFVANDSAAVIESNDILLINTMFAASGPDGPPRSMHRVVHEFQYYPGFGLRTRGWTRRPDRGFTFVNWNVYEIANAFIPVQNPLEEDALIRLSMHLEERMRMDDGWPRTGRFSRFYPEGDRFTAHARSFPPLAYLWTHLTVEGTDGEWTHVGSDADLFYQRLQSLFKFFDPGSDAHFADTLTTSRKPYIAYSAAVKEIDATDTPVNGILNTHADALQFVWIMAEASELYGEQDRALRWSAAVNDFHEGSKELFERLYPARDSVQIHTGLLQYSLSQPDYFPIEYSMKSFNGIVAGYLQHDEYELAFVDAVERAVHLRYPQRRLAGRWGASAAVGRLVRALPIALSTAGDTVSMSRDAGSASLKELLTIGHLLRDTTNTHPVRRMHNNNRLIVVDGGSWLVSTNASFVSDWVSGYWEEVDPDSLPADRRFRAIVESASGADGRWTVARRGGDFLVLTNHTTAGGGIELATPVWGYTLSLHAYADGQWSEPQVLERVVGTLNGERAVRQILLPPLGPKDLLRVSLFSAARLRWLLPVEGHDSSKGHVANSICMS